ncbi:hypothetical protein ACIPWL_31765 [Streptomyces sp. NPDC090023]|uniref:hypothetical protein n=1 Tax=unclassified Streptomyces TaxID=2593676 RepID=UPI00136EF160|nr:hypothetical protein [Streptomyces sp. SID1328]MYV41071.1 hypothetical protein [Streptomyces sp. SID1328]
MEGKTPVENGDEQNDQEAVEQRQERRRLVKQFLIDWSPVMAGLADLAVRHFS